MLAVLTPSVTLRAPPELVPEKLGCLAVAKLISAKSIVSWPVVPATVPEKLDELSSCSVPSPGELHVTTIVETL